MSTWDALKQRIAHSWSTASRETLANTVSYNAGRAAQWMTTTMLQSTLHDPALVLIVSNTVGPMTQNFVHALFTTSAPLPHDGDGPPQILRFASLADRTMGQGAIAYTLGAELHQGVYVTDSTIHSQNILPYYFGTDTAQDQFAAAFHPFAVEHDADPHALDLAAQGLWIDQRTTAAAPTTIPAGDWSYGKIQEAYFAWRPVITAQGTQYAVLSTTDSFDHADSIDFTESLTQPPSLFPDIPQTRKALQTLNGSQVPITPIVYNPPHLINQITVYPHENQSLTIERNAPINPVHSLVNGPTLEITQWNPVDFQGTPPPLTKALWFILPITKDTTIAWAPHPVQPHTIIVAADAQHPHQPMLWSSPDKAFQYCQQAGIWTQYYPGSSPSAHELVHHLGLIKPRPSLKM